METAQFQVLVVVAAAVGVVGVVSVFSVCVRTLSSALCRACGCYPYSSVAVSVVGAVSSCRELRSCDCSNEVDHHQTYTTAKKNQSKCCVSIFVVS